MSLLRVTKAKVFDCIPKIGFRPDSINPNIATYELTQNQIDFFHQNGYLVVERFLQPTVISSMLQRFTPIFSGDLITKIYPDEWYGARGMSLPNQTKEICNAWKSDSILASVLLSSQIHSIVCQLNDWNGSRIAQDDILWKPKKGGKHLGFHQDSEYISNQFTPLDNNSITVWMPLDDVCIENGSLEFLKGSHLWPKCSNDEMSDLSFHAHDCEYDEKNQKHREIMVDYLMKYLDMNVNDIEFVSVEIPAGGVSFHHQNTWHGSGVNVSQMNDRRVIVAHTLNSDCIFNILDCEQLHNNISYIYGKYVMDMNDGSGKCSPKLNERFFPIAYHKNNEIQSQMRSKWLQHFCNNENILV